MVPLALWAVVLSMDSKIEDGFSSLLAELKRSNELTANLIRVQTDWRLSLRNGLLTGLGGVIGATVLVSLLIWALQPLKRLEILKEPLDRIAQQLERTPKK